MAETTKKEKTIIERLIKIQQGLKAPKSKESRDKYGKVRYTYRSCEDILEAVKPLLKDTGCVLTISDEIINIADRFYVKATATLQCDDAQITTSALAREDNNANMSGAQCTGAASSYARKYCLNGLFAIDDTKDADDIDAMNGTQQAAQGKIDSPEKVMAFCDQNGISLARLCGFYKIRSVKEFTADRYEHLNANLQAMIHDMTERGSDLSTK